MNKRQKEIAYTKCKTWMHSMDTAPPSTPTTVEFGFVLRCDRCGTLRHVEIDPVEGFVTGSTYDWPDDYRELGTKLSRQELRLAEAKLWGQKQPRRLRAV